MDLVAASTNKGGQASHDLLKKIVRTTAIAPREMNRKSRTKSIKTNRGG
jgi:hypothetical protein